MHPRRSVAKPLPDASGATSCNRAATHGEGIRIEELTELSHHSLVQYRLPSTGELIPLLQIAPSKTDTERLLVISPELADVLSAIIARIRDSSGAVPLVVSYDDNEKLWNPPMPLLLQRRLRAENRPVTPQAIRDLLGISLDQSGLTDASGRPLRFAPHDFRRMLITDAKMGRIASDATFPRRREHALPAAQRAALRRSGRGAAQRNALDLGCQQPVASGLTMMRPVRLHRTPA